jgi:hypothetical protein
VVGALAAIDLIEDPVEGGVIGLPCRPGAGIRAKGSKRTAFLLTRWLLDRKGQDGAALLTSDDRLLPSCR